ncbi:MAG: pyridoxal-phosphate dependent enzyme [Anaerolineae bacterium]|nr:pyridoxal-phosphate dependent enzyme [Anaerolineae bacterium]
MTGHFFTEVVCLECGHSQAAAAAAAACPACGSGWLDARYDYAAVAPIWAGGLGQRPDTLWRYAELLPVRCTHPEISLGEGGTPLNRLYGLENACQHHPIYVKDERSQPTHSFKDRQAVVAVMALRQQGITECVLASTGNAAVAYAAACARAGIKLWLFLTSLVTPDKMREAALYGCEIVKVSGTYDETKQVAAEFARRRGLHFDRGARSIPGKESLKTLAYEIAGQLGHAAAPDVIGHYAAPDWYIQAVSGGIGPLGVWKGFQELYTMGLIDRLPKLAIVQAEGCSPMVQAFQRGERHATPVKPQTLITVLATGDPGFAYSLLYDAVRSHGGTMRAVSDGATFRAMRGLARRAGLSVEPAAAVAFAGLEELLQDGTIAPGATVVVNASGHTFTAESHTLGDQYDRYVHELTVNSASPNGPRLEEGLGAALQHLNERVTTIVVVDDNPHDRRLIRRLLHSYRRYRVYEARDGLEALRVIQDYSPDLVVTDLMMPEMDGFGLLAALKSDPHTAALPVIVVSAKTLTVADRKRLEQRATSVWQKGDMNTQRLIEHVVDTLGEEHETLEVVRQTQERAALLVPPAEESTYSHTIVVIDDNPYDLRLARRILQSESRYSVIEASSGRDGLKAIYSYHPDLVVLDLNLPDVDGFSIVETLQQDSDLRDIPVVLYTAHELTAAERDRVQSIRQVVQKAGLSKDHFLDVIRDQLE